MQIAPYRYGATPNTLINPQVLGLPGALPRINLYAIRQAVVLGLILDCDVQFFSTFDRKNYFYPDNSKNYQITQQYHPLHIGGHVEVVLSEAGSKEEGIHKRISLHHIHLEEDVGKLTHAFTCYPY